MVGIAPAWVMHAMECVFKILFQCSKRTNERCLAGNQNIIKSGVGTSIGKLESRRLESSPDSVANNRASKLLGNGETETWPAVLLTAAVTRWPRLAFQSEACARPSGPAPHS